MSIRKEYAITHKHMACQGDFELSIGWNSLYFQRGVKSGYLPILLYRPHLPQQQFVLVHPGTVSGFSYPSPTPSHSKRAVGSSCPYWAAQKAISWWIFNVLFLITTTQSSPALAVYLFCVFFKGLWPTCSTSPFQHPVAKLCSAGSWRNSFQGAPGQPLSAWNTRAL